MGWGIGNATCSKGPINPEWVGLSAVLLRNAGLPCKNFRHNFHALNPFQVYTSVGHPHNVTPKQVVETYRKHMWYRSERMSLVSGCLSSSDLFSFLSFTLSNSHLHIWPCLTPCAIECTCADLMQCPHTPTTPPSTHLSTQGQ